MDLLRRCSGGRVLVHAHELQPDDLRRPARSRIPRTPSTGWSRTRLSRATTSIRAPRRATRRPPTRTPTTTRVGAGHGCSTAACSTTTARSRPISPTPSCRRALISCTVHAEREHALADFAAAYREYKTFKDAAESGLSFPTSPHFVSAGKTFTGRFPGYTEPTSRLARISWPSSAATPPEARPATCWTRRDTRGPVVANYPLVLTSIRCVEHFQGGPTTRNNSWNVEAEPVPWIEINSFDARNAVPPIVDGDWVQIETARGELDDGRRRRCSPNSGSRLGSRLQGPRGGRHGLQPARRSRCGRHPVALG